MGVALVIMFTTYWNVNSTIGQNNICVIGLLHSPQNYLFYTKVNWNRNYYQKGLKAMLGWYLKRMTLKKTPAVQECVITGWWVGEGVVAWIIHKLFCHLLPARTYIIGGIFWQVRQINSAATTHQKTIQNLVPATKE